VNLDVIAVAVLVILLAWVLWLWWGVFRGYPHNRWWQAARIGVSLVLALALVAWGSYVLMDSRTVQVLGDHVSRVDTTRKVVALTFDDGPDDLYAGELIGDLGRYGAHGTFYVVGAEAVAHPAAMTALVASRQEIGNHTYHHRRLVFVSTSTVRGEVGATDAVIRAAGYTGPITVRPPYGKKLLSYPLEMASGGRTTVMWDVEPDSPGRRGGAPAIAKYVADNVRPGSIVLLHPWPAGNAATRRALPMILSELRDLGYSFVTVSELLALR
jgi:peptidoglycan/xylan/chitin deacetylase (PgdA/CDA1 family)